MDIEPKEQQARARKGRVVALVIAATVLAWLALHWLGAQMNWEPRYAFLIDFAALAGFVWALIVTWQIWRNRSD